MLIFSQGCTGSWRVPLTPFRIFITLLNSSSMQHLRWTSLWQKTGKSWKLLVFDPAIHVQKQQKTKQKKQKKPRNVSFIFNVNNKDTRMTAASIANFEHILRFILLLLLLTLNKCWLCFRIYSFRQKIYAQ